MIFQNIVVGYMWRELRLWHVQCRVAFTWSNGERRTGFVTLSFLDSTKNVHSNVRIKQAVRGTSQKRLARMMETEHMKQRKNARPLSYGKENIDEKVRPKMKNVQKLKGKGCVSYIMDSKLQLMKWNELLMSVCKEARPPAMLLSRSQLFKQSTVRIFLGVSGR